MKTAIKLCGVRSRAERLLASKDMQSAFVCECFEMLVLE